jgi:hypothetical protein
MRDAPLKADIDLVELVAQLSARKAQLIGTFEQEGVPPPQTRSMKDAPLPAGEPVA